MEIDILFKDDALVVINKPAGLATLPDGFDPTLPHIKSTLEGQLGALWIVHRLDKGTSGVLILARTAEAHRSLNTQFERHQVSKVYHALVMGNPEWDEKTVDLPLRSNGDRKHRTVVDLRHGKPATTRLNVIERFGAFSLLEAIPETGRTHQIRAHLCAAGLSIVGDALYRRKLPNQKSELTSKLPASNESPQFRPAGMGLHARSLEVNHPLTGERMKFIAPYPDEWGAVLKVIRAGPSVF